MKRWLTFLSGTLVGALIAIAIQRGSTPKSADQPIGDLSEREVQRLEATAQRLFTKGSYPILAAHVRSAEFAMSIYDRRKEDGVVRRECARELQAFMEAASSAAADRELIGIRPLIVEKQEAVDQFIRAHPELAALKEGEANQTLHGTPAEASSSSTEPEGRRP